MARYEPADVQHGNWAAEASQCNVAEVLQLRQFVDCRCHPLSHQDLAVFGLGAQPRRYIGYSADRGVVEAALEADRPQCGIASSDPDAEPDLASPARPSSSERGARL